MSKLIKFLIDKALNGFALLRAILGLILVSRTCLTIFICLITFMLFGHFFFEFSWVNGYTNPYLAKYNDKSDVAIVARDIKKKLGVKFRISDYFKTAELLAYLLAILLRRDSYRFDFYLYHIGERNLAGILTKFTEERLQRLALIDNSKGFILLHYTFVALFS